MIYRPEINPITFFQVPFWDYNVFFPTDSNLPSCISGLNIAAIPITIPWATDNKIQFQLHQERNDNVIVSYVKNGVTTPIVPVDITPTGWEGKGNYVMLYSYTPTTTGDLRFIASEEVVSGKLEKYSSHNIFVRNQLKECQRITYYHRDNTLNAVFNKDSVRVFFPIVYVEATFNEGLIGGVKSVSVTPSQVVRNLRTDNSSGSVLDVALTHESITLQLLMIMACSTINVNGFSYQTKDLPSKEPILGSNASTMRIELWKTDWNYYGDYIPIYAIEPPFFSDILFWFKKSGNLYVDQGPKHTGYTVTEVDGRINFLGEGISIFSELYTDLQFFNRNNLIVQDSQDKPDYDSFYPYSFASQVISQGVGDSVEKMVDWYNDNQMGRLYIKDGKEEIIVYATDKTLLDDRACLEYVDKDNFVGDPIGGENILILAKYNLIKDNQSESVEDPFLFSMTNNSGALTNIEIWTDDGENVLINWGDGNQVEITDQTLTASTVIPSIINIYAKVFGSKITRILSTINSYAFNINSLPNTLDLLQILGSPAITGNISTLPSLITWYNIQGNTVTNTYISGHVFDSGIALFNHLPAATFGLLSSDIDNILIDLDASNMSTGSIDISGNNAARTVASDAAVTSLQGKGVVVTTN